MLKSLSHKFDYLLIFNQGTFAAPKKTVRASESVPFASSGGLDNLPREDISGKITPLLLKGLESPDWKVLIFCLVKCFFQLFNKHER